MLPGGEVVGDDYVRVRAFTVASFRYVRGRNGNKFGRDTTQSVVIGLGPCFGELDTAAEDEFDLRAAKADGCDCDNKSLGLAGRTQILQAGLLYPRSLEPLLFAKAL